MLQFFELSSLNLFGIGIGLVQKLNAISTTTNHIFKDGIKQVNSFNLILMKLYKTLESILIGHGYQKAIGRSPILIMVLYLFVVVTNLRVI